MKKSLNKPLKPLEPKVQIVGSVQAGFPIHSDGYAGEELNLSLDKLLIKRPDSTFLMRVTGLSMKNVGIFEGDLVVVERARKAKNGDIVICYLDQGFNLKRLYLKDGSATLLSEDGQMPPISIGKSEDDQIWGVVTAVIRQLHS